MPSPIFQCRLALGLLFAVLSLLQAFAKTVFADTNDCEAQWTLTNPPIAIADLTTTTLIAGTAGTAGKERCPVMPFQLPDFGAVNNPFLSASFSCNISSYTGTPVGNADLYGLGRRASATVLTNDYWAGTSAVDPTDATFLQGNLLLAPPATGIVASSVAGSTALANYLNAQYAGGAGAGQFVFLRLSTDTAQTGVARWQLTSAEGGAANTNNWPQINYTLLPTNAPVDSLRVETRADGAGVVVPATNLATGMVLTNFSIARNSGGVFLTNLPSVWMLTNVTGSVAASDLVAAPDGKSARFTANGAGSARILAVANATNLVASGVIAVTNVVLYTDTGSPTNPPWSQILPTLNVDSADPGPVYGSLINVNNVAVEVGLYGNRPISVPSQRIHVACNTSTTSFANFTRWFQTDGNTHVLRVFVDDENTATTRAGTSSHTEAFMAGGWNYTNNVTYEWSGHYTIAYLRQGYAAFQLKNSDNDWAFQLSIGSTGTLGVNNRNGADVTVTNANGSAKNFNGGGFDMRVLDDGKFYKVWIDGVLYADGSYTRPTGTSTFRWGMYFGANNLNPPADYNLVLISGPQIKSWPGNLATATTTVIKSNNTSNLDTGASWVGGVDPGIYNQAVWDNTVTAANTTTLASDQQWAGIKILNPGGMVTINGGAILSLDDSGVDMTAATQNLTVNCRVQLTTANTWGVAPSRTATFNGIVSGFSGITVNGGGNLLLNAANTYSGDTTLSAGTLVANNNSALGAGKLIFNGGSLSNSTSCTLANGVNLNSNAAVGVGTSQTLTLNGNISGTGSLTKNGQGQLTLSGTNTYTGNTVVNGGNIQVLLPKLATNSTVSVAQGAVLGLQFTGTNIVAGFITNGVALSTGVYNIGNAAPFIAGSGSLKVASIAPPPPTIAPVAISGRNLVVSVATVLGANYVLQSATNLTPTIDWQNESTNAGTGGDLILNVPIKPSQLMKYLRLWVY